jgi:HAD superfamily hydrolase (TIGR01509 family)
MLKHILFDNDGTIVDSEIIAVRSTLRLLKDYNFHMDEQEYSRRFPGLLERDILAILKKEYGLQVGADYLDRLRQAHIEEFDQALRVIPGMAGLFRRLKVPKSMVSNGSVRHVERCLRKVRLLNALDGHIFSAEHVSAPKPEPHVYLHALDTLRLRPAETVVVEDSPTGVAAAKAAGLQVIGFLGAAHVYDGHEEKLREKGADYIAADAVSLGKLFQSWGAL